MPNIVDATGLQTKTLQNYIDEILNGTPTYPGFIQIFGADANTGPNTPDGQWINIFAEAAADETDLIAQVYASFDPDQAIGRVLDQRCAINGVVRSGATYTQTLISVTATQAIMIDGLDSDPTAPFTVSDAAGNQFQLVTAYSFLGAGTQALLFQSVAIGPVLTTPNTITQIVTVTLGISTVNNPSAAAVIGITEETDAALRIRRANSVSLPSKGYLEGLVGALEDTAGVIQAIVLENVTATPDGNGIPGHSIWCIVLGGANADVAHAIYVKRNAGCGMKGAVTVAVPAVDGSTPVPIQFDRPTVETLWIKFDMVAITGTTDDNNVRQQLLAALSYKIGQSADTTTIVALVKQFAPNASVSNEGVSDTNSGYVTLKAPTALNYLFTPASVRIIINGTPGT